MPKGTGKQRPPQQPHLLVQLYRSFATSVRSIGADTAIYGLAIVLSFGALIVGASALAVFGLATLFVVGWLATKWINLLIAERQEKLALLRQAEERGTRILKAYEAEPQQLSLLCKDDQG